MTKKKKITERRREKKRAEKTGKKTREKVGETKGPDVALTGVEIKLNALWGHPSNGYTRG